jgi:hypothetical protein
MHQMLTTFGVKNFKSIVDLEIELGRFNVFIGENGCGKSNVLEAVALAAAWLVNERTNEHLFQRGVRVAKPSLMTNAFKRAPTDPVSCFDVTEEPLPSGLQPTHIRVDIGSWNTASGWIDYEIDRRVLERKQQRHAATSAGGDDWVPFARRELASFAIYTANTLALRGLHTLSRHEPLGIFGEGLDVAIAQLPADRRDELIEHAHMIAWFDDIEIDHTGQRKLRGDKPGRSVSDLYFADRFLAEDRRVFSAENANEGILHVLFYLALFLHPSGPRIMGIDNIETALNPHLLRRLVKVLAALAVKHDRQALVTTHNPAALDGLNLHDDTQRLFIVSRNDDGHTQVKRVVTKPDRNEGGVKLKLSELWMRGMLGGIPTHF